MYSEQQLRLIIDTIPTLAWSARADGAAEFFNRRWLEFAGLSSEQAREWGWSVALHPDDLDRVVTFWRSLRCAGEPGEIEVRLRRHDGQFRWFLFRASPLRDESGKVAQWYGINIDIEDRKCIEDALRQREQQLRVVVENIAGLVAVMSSEGEVEFVNQLGLRYFGKTLDELRGWRTSDAVHPDDLPSAITAWKHSVETGDPYEIDHRLHRAIFPELSD
jgi:PAS domain S-box-containing protein